MYHDAKWNKHVILPKCCEKAAKGAVWLSVSGVFYHGDEEPQWVTLTTMEERDFEEAHFCPFCGTAVPELEKAEPQGPVCVSPDGGHYCDTCRNRLSDCTCLPLDTLWKLQEK